jgi:hypothetical protein
MTHDEDERAARAQARELCDGHCEAMKSAAEAASAETKGE